MIQSQPKYGHAESDTRSQAKAVLYGYGFFYFPILQGVGSYNGIPDLIAVGHGVTLFIELKSCAGTKLDGKKIGNGVQSKEQVKFQQDVEQHGGTYLLIHSGYELECWLWDQGYRETWNKGK